METEVDSFLLEFSSPRMISESFEVEKQTENETKKRVHLRFKLGTSKSPQKLSASFPARPLDLTPWVRREWEEKSIA